jgi:hypothetical protein
VVGGPETAGPDRAAAPSGHGRLRHASGGQRAGRHWCDVAREVLAAVLGDEAKMNRLTTLLRRLATGLAVLVCVVLILAGAIAWVVIYR